MSEHTRTVSETEPRSTERTPRNDESDARLRWGVHLITVAGLAYVVHGIGFIYRTYFTDGFELGVDELDGWTAADLAATHPEVASYIAHVHVSFAGLMIAVGVGLVALARYGIRRGHRWAWATALGIPLLFGAFTIPVHGSVHFDFDLLLHLGPAGVGLVILLVGGVLAHYGLRSSETAANTREVADVTGD